MVFYFGLAYYNHAGANTHKIGAHTVAPRMLTPMSNSVLALLSILPIASVAIFLVALRWPASRAMSITYVVCAALALFVWQVPATVVTAATINGIVVAATLIFRVYAD